MQPIYLDNNATTLIDPAVAAKMQECLAEGFVNPASQHQPGQRARRQLELLRQDALKILGASYQGANADQLVFTSGGTESNNLALSGLAWMPDGSQPEYKRVLISAIEHPSVVARAKFLATQGFKVELVAVDGNGVLDLDDLRRKLDDPARLISVMLANNETGVIQPCQEIAGICSERGVLFHTDAVQAVGKIDVNFQILGVDALTFTAHKLHGPRGIGGLVLRHGIRPFPLLFGGFQQAGARPGTEDVCLVTGLVEALRLFEMDTDRSVRIEQLRDRLQHQICERCQDIVDVAVNGGGVARVPHTLNVSFAGINRQAMLMAADMNGLAVSSGSACASGSSELSPVLLAMGLDNEVVEGSIRISLSAFTTRSEVDFATDRIVKIANDLRLQKRT